MFFSFPYFVQSVVTSLLGELLVFFVELGNFGVAARQLGELGGRLCACRGGSVGIVAQCGARFAVLQILVGGFPGASFGDGSRFGTLLHDMTRLPEALAVKFICEVYAIFLI